MELKYRTHGEVESYIALATSYISFLSEGTTFSAEERVQTLQGIAETICEYAASSKKGLKANPSVKICVLFDEEDNDSVELHVNNTQGRRVLTVYFD